MKFEIHETVLNPDPEIVLRALEMCSRDISDDVVRSGGQITLRGLGPSPRSKNRHDTTVFCVNADSDKTLIQGEVNFQASALLGDQSQQDVVRSKLDGLFDQMKAQIHLDSMRVAAYAAARRSAAAATAVMDRPEKPSAIEPREPEPRVEKTDSSVTPETLVEAKTTAPDSGRSAVALIAEPQVVVVPDQSAELPYVEESKDSGATVQPLPAESKEEPEKVSAWEKIFESERKKAEQNVATEQVVQPKPAVESQLPEEPTWAARTPPYRLRIEDDRTGSKWKPFALWATALIFILALAGRAYFLFWSHHDRPASPPLIAVKSAGVPMKPLPKVEPQKKAEKSPVPPPALSSAPSAAIPPVPPAAISPTPPAALPDSTAQSATSNAELKPWLQSWAASMRTKDANAQAAFYAEVLDRYLDQRNVGRAAVLRDREATIHMRKGLWIVKMEDIVIERQTATQADVRLVKHFIDEPEQSEILESYVPTRLTLKHINGQWQITSEQDLPSLTVTPWKGRG